MKVDTQPRSSAERPLPPTTGRWRVLACLTAALLASTVTVFAPAEELVRVSERILPSELNWALDVRWAADDQLILAAGKFGVFRLDLGAASPSFQQVIGDDKSPNGFWFAARMASSPEYLVVSAPAHNLAWLRTGTTALAADFPIAAISDLDVQGKRLALLGARRGDDEQSTWSPDGAIAWLGSLDRDLQDLKPILYSTTPHAKSMADCDYFEHGGIRFLRDGSVLVVPGVEEGVFLLDGEGRLQRTWEAEKVGLDVGCGPAAEPDAHSRFARDWRLRHQGFLNSRRILDDILDLPQGPGLVVRTVADGVTRWQLRLLPLDGGEILTYDVPVTSTSPFAHLRGDVTDTPPYRMIFLLLEYRELTDAPSVAPRVLVTEVPDAQARRVAVRPGPAAPLTGPASR